MQFYARYQDEVIAEPAAIAAHVERAREVLGEPFRVIFDEALVVAHRRLIAEPRNRVDADPTMAEVVRSRLRDLLPVMAETLKPPGEGALDLLGIAAGELARYGLEALTRRLAIIGVAL